MPHIQGQNIRLITGVGWQFTPLRIRASINKVSIERNEKTASVLHKMIERILPLGFLVIYSAGLLELPIPLRPSLYSEPVRLYDINETIVRLSFQWLADFRSDYCPDLYRPAD